MPPQQLELDLWLLLGDTGCSIRHQLSYEVGFSVDFYDREARHQGGRAGIWIIEFVSGEKEHEV